MTIRDNIIKGFDESPEGIDDDDLASTKLICTSTSK